MKIIEKNAVYDVNDNIVKKELEEGCGTIIFS